MTLPRRSGPARVLLLLAALPLGLLASCGGSSEDGGGAPTPAAGSSVSSPEPASGSASGSAGASASGSAGAPAGVVPAGGPRVDLKNTEVRLRLRAPTGWKRRGHEFVDFQGTATRGSNLLSATVLPSLVSGLDALDKTARAHVRVLKSTTTTAYGPAKIRRLPDLQIDELPWYHLRVQAGHGKSDSVDAGYVSEEYGTWFAGAQVSVSIQFDNFSISSDYIPPSKRAQVVDSVLATVSVNQN